MNAREIVLKANAMRLQSRRPDEIRAFVFREFTTVAIQQGVPLTEVSDGRFWSMTVNDVTIVHDRDGYVVRPSAA